MKLNQFTDYGLRILMYLSQKEQGSIATITELSEKFNISRNHLVKVVQFLSNKNVIAAQRGRGGGLALALPPEEIRIGQLVLLLEENDCVIDCDTRSCILSGSCFLKHALNSAYKELINTLDKYTLKDVCAGKTGVVLKEMVGS